MQKTFTTERPPTLYVELRSGTLVVQTAETDQTVVDVAGEGGDDASTVAVEQRGDQVAVVATRGAHSLFGGGQRRLVVHVTMPHDSGLTTKLGSAELQVAGRLGRAQLKSGSGDVRIEEVAGDAVIESGSGDIFLDTVHGSLRVSCGSGDVTLDQLGGRAQVSTGSGSVTVVTAREPVAVKSGSGDMRVRQARADVALSTASGDLVVDRMERGRLVAKSASGDITVGVPAGVPVWTDLSTVTGTISSDLDGAGEPQEGQDHVELRGRSMSGDVRLLQL